MFVMEEQRLTAYQTEGLAEIVIPQGVQTIGARVFLNRTEIRRVVLGEDVKTIGEEAFAGCTSLEEVVWNSGLRRVGEGCFRGCVKLRSAILPDETASLRAGAFEGCEALETVRLPQGLRRNVETLVFSGCRSLRSVRIPKGADHINFRAFLGCESLETVEFENPDVFIDFGAFAGCSNLDQASLAFIESHLFSAEKADIRSSAPGARGRLSNFTPRSFVFDGVACGSIEGVLQSLKCSDAEKQKELCALSGFAAQKAGREYTWAEKQELYWQGETYPRLSAAYQKLLDRLYTAVYEQDEQFRADLEELRGMELEHRIGRSDARRTILTRGEFAGRLQRLSLQRGL